MVHEGENNEQSNKRMAANCHRNLCRFGWRCRLQTDEILATLGYPLTAENRSEAEQFVLRVYRRGLKENFEWPALGDVIT
jgi:hypothetical protein